MKFSHNPYKITSQIEYLLTVYSTSRVFSFIQSAW